MRKKVLTLLSFMLFLLSPNPASADCANLSNFTDWVREGEHTIVFYMENTPYCEILPSSAVRLSTFSVCDLDDIIIDDKTCTVRTVEVLD